jgi:hypothetical protein
MRPGPPDEQVSDYPLNAMTTGRVLSPGQNAVCSAAVKGSETVRRRLDVFHAQVDFGLSAMVRSLSKAVPQGLEHADLRALILVNSDIELIRSNRLNFTHTLIVGLVEEFQRHGYGQDKHKIGI